MRRSACIERRSADRFRVRARIDGRRVTLGDWLTHAEAEEVLHAFEVERSRLAAGGALTVGGWGSRVIEDRALAGARSAESYARVWAALVLPDEIGALTLRDVRRSHVVAWLRRLEARRARSGSRLAPQTRRNALNLLRVVLREALDRELVALNAAADVRVSRSTSERAQTDFQVVGREQIPTLLAAVEEPWRHLVAFAIFSGVRQGEQWALRWDDVHVDDAHPHVVIRFGGQNRATKTGRTRVVPLLAPALDALEVARAQRTGELVFPGRLGGRRTNPRSWWHRARLAIGMPTLRWHDLRHTCATALLAGWWGRAWSLSEVSQMLGHRGTAVTERYAHRLDATLLDAAAATHGGRGAGWGDGGRDSGPVVTTRRRTRRQESC